MREVVFHVLAERPGHLEAKADSLPIRITALLPFAAELGCPVKGQAITGSITGLLVLAADDPAALARFYGAVLRASLRAAGFWLPMIATDSERFRWQRAEQLHGLADGAPVTVAGAHFQADRGLARVRFESSQPANGL